MSLNDEPTLMRPLSATYVPKWKPNTAYNAGDAVLSPAGDTVTAIANFTSGASFNAANWNQSAIYASQFTATASTTAADVNAWLATPYNGVKRLAGALTLAAPLVIKSGTRLDASGATITSTFVGHMIHNENYDSTTTRDSNIAITGGTWQRNAGGPGSGTGNGWANTAHSIFFRHVNKLTIRDLRVGSTGGKYMIAIGDVTDFYVADIHASSVASDTVHMTGPCSDGVVERVRVASGGDDCVAFTTTDYVSYDDVHGSFNNVTVRDVTTNNSTRVVLVGGSASGADDGYTLANIAVENVDQMGAGQGVTVAGPFSTALLPSLALRNIKGGVLLQHKNLGTVIAENTGTVTLSPESGQASLAVQRLIIRDPRPSAEIVSVNNATVNGGDLEVHGAIKSGNAALALSQGTFRTVTVKSLNYTGTTHAITSGATITTLNLEGFTGTLSAGSAVINLFAGSIGTVNVTNPAYTAADTSSGILVKAASGATLGTLNLNGGLLTAIGRILDTVAGVTGTINVNLTNTTCSGCNRILQAGDGTVNVSYANVAYNSGINQPFRVFGAANLNVRGSGWGGYAASTIPAPGTGVVHVTARDLPVDLSILAKTNGDAANNTNGALACGAGPAISNGTSWKNIYSGTVY